jgi:NAD(P)H-hydrate repair Nnr-like enzyme with NAD(P)H-hydrate epimerase domain
MIKYVSVAEMQSIERQANASGLSYERMMENAGRGLAEAVLEQYGYLAEDGALGLVGSGNNGGDTLVALTYLAQEGWKASAAILRPRPAGDPLVARLQAAGGQVAFLDEHFDQETLGQLWMNHRWWWRWIARRAWTATVGMPLRNASRRI